MHWTSTKKARVRSPVQTLPGIFPGEIVHCKTFLSFNPSFINWVVTGFEARNESVRHKADVTSLTYVAVCVQME